MPLKAVARFASIGRLSRLILPVQLLLTAAVLGWVPGNSTKLALMVVVWAITFGRVTARELLMMAAVNLLFAAMNAAALKRGVFAFQHPDFLGMPVYEYLMWGFYTLHTIRFLDGAAPQRRTAFALAAAAAFALPFAVIANPNLLALASAGVLCACFAVFHRRLDFVYAGYMVLVGAVIEGVGVATGQWHYPGQYDGGVPPWFLAMWAGVGLFTRRLLLPLVYADRVDWRVRGDEPIGRERQGN